MENLLKGLRSSLEDLGIFLLMALLVFSYYSAEYIDKYSVSEYFKLLGM